MIDDAIKALEQIPQFENYMYAALLLFPRFLGFMILAPAFSRKDVPGMVKLSFAMLMTVAFLGDFKETTPPPETSFFLSIILNVIFGIMVGFLARTIFETIRAAGEMVNMQMGLQSAVMFDPSSKSQTSVMGRFFSYLGTIIFIQIGGLFWIFLAFKRGFDVFPLYAQSIPLTQIVDLNYITFISGNLLFIGLQIASPVIITTLCQDLILGIISKTSPQVNVFQLSFLFKPVVGTVIMLIILPLTVNTIVDYFHYFARIY